MVLWHAQRSRLVSLLPRLAQTLPVRLLLPSSHLPLDVPLPAPRFPPGHPLAWLEEEEAAAPMSEERRRELIELGFPGGCGLPAPFMSQAAQALAFWQRPSPAALLCDAACPGERRMAMLWSMQAACVLRLAERCHEPAWCPPPTRPQTMGTTT